MTSKEAIRILELYNPFLGGDDKKILSEAIELAIEALKTHDVPDTNVGDMISRQSAIQAINEYLDEYSGLDEEGYHGEKWCAMAEAKMVIENLQSTQPDLSEYSDKLWRSAYERGKRDAQSEIVRCKDCKHHWTHRCMDSMPTEICDLNQTFYDSNIDFCSLAERRGE